MEELDMSKEYSERFEELRRNRIEIGFYKYGTVRKIMLQGIFKRYQVWKDVYKNIRIQEIQNFLWM